MQICDDKEAKPKEDIVNLKIKLAELEKFEEGVRKQHQERENECERLEVGVVSLRKKWKMEKSTLVLDILLEIQRSSLDRSDLAFQNGKSSLHANKNNKQEPKKLVANNSSSKGTNQGNKKQNQHLKRKPQGAPTFRRYFASRGYHGRSVRFQRNQIPFIPLMRKVECYNCHKLGHIASNCKSITHTYNQWNL